jgi:hypothetical protein
MKVKFRQTGEWQNSLKQYTELSCPVSFTLVDQTKIRVVAFFVFVLSAMYLLLAHWSIAALLCIDFFVRAFNKGQYSFFAWMAGGIVKQLSFPAKPVNGGPKRFAAQIGFSLSAGLFLATIAGLHRTGIFIAALLFLFSFLEWVFGFCAGCHVYTIYQRLFGAKKTPAALV